jgi:hypothetical protein
MRNYASAVAGSAATCSRREKSGRANACLCRHTFFPVRRRNFQQLRRTSSAFAQKSGSLRKSD